MQFFLFVFFLILFVVDIGDKWKRETASPEDSLFVVLMVGEPLTHVTDKD
jgi:hypothetical protein